MDSIVKNILEQTHSKDVNTRKKENLPATWAETRFSSFAIVTALTLQVD